MARKPLNKFQKFVIGGMVLGAILMTAPNSVKRSFVDSVTHAIKSVLPHEQE